MHRKLGLGMRTIKTGLAILLAFWITDLLQFTDGSLAAITTIVAVQPSLKSSVKTMNHQLIATAFGSILAAAVAYYFQGSYWAISLAAVLGIMLCVRVNLKDSVPLLLITIIVIGQTSLINFEMVIFQRVSSIVIGLLIGFVLNLVLIPKHNDRLIAQVEKVRSEYEILFHDCIDDLIRDEHLSKDEVQRRMRYLKDEIQGCRNIYTYSIESKIHYDEKTQKDTLYLIRKAINALSSNTERLIELHRSIIFAPKVEEDWQMKRLIHQYLKSIFENHKRIYGYILFDTPLEEDLIMRFDRLEDDLERTMLHMFHSLNDLQPIHYWNIVVEAERIMLKAWGLVVEKKQMKGEPITHNLTEQYYKSR